MTDPIKVERDGGCATVVLNRPEKLNAITKAMWRRLGEVMETLSADDGLRCIVVRGAGGKAFSPGNDISEFAHERADIGQGRDYGVCHHGALKALRECRHPTVALIEGVCVGGGLEIAALCDLRIAGASSRFGVPSNRLGLVLAHAEIAGLLELVGRAAALEILLEGQIFDADKALAMGLVNRVVADDGVEAEAYETAKRIAEAAPLVNRWHKKFINRLADPAPLTAAERDEGFACYGTEDYQTGTKAFLAKTKPQFKGR